MKYFKRKGEKNLWHKYYILRDTYKENFNLKWFLFHFNELLTLFSVQ